LIDKLVFILYDDSKCRIYLKDNVRVVKNMRLLLSVYAVLLILLLITCKDVQYSDDPYSALLRLQNRNDYNRYVIISAAGTEYYIQFFLYENSVFFDRPLYGEIKDKYYVPDLSIDTDKNEKDLWVIKYIDDNAILRFKDLLDKFEIEYEFVREGFIEPTPFNQTDTTGWVNAIRGQLKLEKELVNAFVNSIFIEAYGVENEKLVLNIKEDVFQP